MSGSGKGHISDRPPTQERHVPKYAICASRPIAGARRAAGAHVAGPNARPRLCPGGARRAAGAQCGRAECPPTLSSRGRTVRRGRMPAHAFAPEAPVEPRAHMWPGRTPAHAFAPEAPVEPRAHSVAGPNARPRLCAGGAGRAAGGGMPRAPCGPAAVQLLCARSSRTVAIDV